MCCDLLKIHYLCGDKDNGGNALENSYRVVICSKFITFAVTKTIYRIYDRKAYKLWFAQNSLPLRWQRQFNAVLISIYFVVICSKFITFAVTKTIWKQHLTTSCMLWFAQNSLPLRWQRQFPNVILYKADVVICSKFITFAVTKTIGGKSKSQLKALWFAQNSLPLRWQRQ